MTRARILKPAQPAPQAASLPHRPALDLPWLPDSPAPPRPRRSAAATAAATLAAKRFAIRAQAQVSRTAAGLARGVTSLHEEAGSAAEHAIASPATPARQASPRRGSAPLTMRQRAALLLAIITVPAMAAPRDLALFAPSEPAAALAPDPLALAAAKALPFERPGMSFPGSAFFFLDDPPAAAGALVALPTADPLDTGAEAGRTLGEFIRTGPAAKPFFSAGTGISHGRAQECLAQAVWYEAASESEAGQRAVAQVVLNRVAHPGWPASVCGVVYQGSERSTGCQFTFTCDGSLARRPGGASWARAQAIAAAALAGEVYAPVGHATHYHTLWVNPYWARTLDHVGTIGAHRFYRNRGAGGEKAAFTMAYAGFEPAVSGRMTAAPAAAAGVTGDFAAPGPLGTATSAAERPFENSGRLIAEAAPDKNTAKGKGKARGKAKAPAAQGAGSEFQGSGDVLPEFANVGKWKADPAAVK